MKRIAALGSLALAISGFLAIPAQASDPINLITSATAVTPAGTTATQVAGPGNIVSVSNTVVSGAAAKSVFFMISGGATASGATSGTLAPGESAFIATKTPGTITVLGYAVTNGAAATSPTDTIIITVIASIPGTVYSSSIVLAATSTSLPTASSDASFNVTAPNGASNVANFTVEEKDAQGNTMLAANAVPIQVVANNALVSSPNLAASPSATSTVLGGTPINPLTDFVVSGIPGYGGNATINISVNNVLVKSYTLKFTGPAAKLVLTAINSVVGVGTYSSLLPVSLNAPGITANTNALEVQEFDASGNLLATTPSHLAVNSLTSSIATAGPIDGYGNFTLGDIKGGTLSSTSGVGVSVNGVAPGTATFTVTDTSINLSSNPVTLRVSSGIPTSVKFTTDASNYNLGAQGTLTTTLSDTSGPMPAGTYAVLSAQAVASIALSSGSTSLPGAPISISGVAGQQSGLVTVNNVGVYAFSFNAPNTDSNVTISATPLNNSISVTPATFVVGAGVNAPVVAAADAITESYDAATAADDSASLNPVSPDAADLATQTAITQTSDVQGVVTAQAALVTVVLSKLAALTASRVKIAAKVVKK